MKRRVSIRARWLLPVLVFCAALGCVLLLTTASRGDFGDYSGDSDWGDSDSYDSYGYDYDDDDYDYADDYDYGHDDDGDSSYTYKPYVNREYEGMELVWQLILTVLVLGGALWLVIRQLGGGRGSRGGSRSTSGRTYQKKTYKPAEIREPTQKGRRVTGTGDVPEGLKPMGTYRDLDPAFDEEALRRDVAALWLRMQECWRKKDIEALRPYLSSMFFEQADRQLAAHRAAKQTNVIERPEVVSVRLKGYRQEGGTDVLVVELLARFIDYTVDDATGEVVKGSRTDEKDLRYRWELIRPTGTLTGSDDAETPVVCPHCGAEVTVNQSAKCPYCGSVLTVRRHDFVLNKITALAQKTVRGS